MRTGEDIRVVQVVGQLQREHVRQLAHLLVERTDKLL
jgi:hypothetical protein